MTTEEILAEKEFVSKYVDTVKDRFVDLILDGIDKTMDDNTAVSPMTIGVCLLRLSAAVIAASAGTMDAITMPPQEIMQEVIEHADVLYQSKKRVDRDEVARILRDLGLDLD